MDGDSEVIALVLEESPKGSSTHRYARGAKRLVRSADGRVSLEAIESDEEFERVARTSGCFKRGKAIRDPISRQVIGYEMEEVRLYPTAAYT
ncbi:MAG TPA: hypothetical protein VIC71_08655 [Gammaproteobacteria bacterium]|jgi:hypothetical protein